MFCFTTRLHYLVLDAFLLSLILIPSHPYSSSPRLFSVNSSSLAFCFSSYFSTFLLHTASSSGAKRETLTDDLTLLSATFPVRSWNVKQEEEEEEEKKAHEVSYRHPHHMGKELKSAGLYITLGHITEHILPFLLLFSFSPPLRSTKRASSLAQLMAN